MTTITQDGHYYATYTGFGEFFTGITTGCRVIVHARNMSGEFPQVTVTRLDDPGAWLALSEPYPLTDISSGEEAPF